MRRMMGPTLALVLTLAGAGGAWAQEPGDTPDLDVDITIDVITDFDHLDDADIGAGERDDDGDIHVVLPEDRDGDHHDGAEVGDHETEAGDHESEVEDHESEVDEGSDDVGGFDEGADDVGDEHDD